MNPKFEFLPQKKYIYISLVYPHRTNERMDEWIINPILSTLLISPPFLCPIFLWLVTVLLYKLKDRVCVEEAVSLKTHNIN